MGNNRPAVVWGQLAAHAAEQGQAASIADVCAVAAGTALVSGAWVAVADDKGPGFVMCVTDPLGEQLAELQLMLGEGPCYDVLASAAPVLASDLDDAEFSRWWPAFTPEARRLGAAAVFVFPLIVGVIRAGVMGLYRSSPGPLAAGQLGDLLILADAATVLLLDGADHAAHVWTETISAAKLDGQAPELALHRAEVDQATGMLTEQLGVSAAQAFARLRAYAYAQDRRLAEVASDIVARRLRLHPDLAQDGEP